MKHEEWEMGTMKRNYGLDLLRLVSMLMVVLLHVLNRGGVISATSPSSLGYWLLWLLEAVAFCGVDCFALITGYVYAQGKHRFSSLAVLWLQTVFYTLGIGLLVWCFRPDLFSLQHLSCLVFPVGKNLYWYISAYFALFLLIPFLNAGLEGLSQKQTGVLLVLAFLVFSVYGTLTGRDPFRLNNGYSTIWLVLLYLAGAYIRKYGLWESLSTGRATLICLGCALFSVAAKLAMGKLEGLSWWPFSDTLNFISFTSPTTVVSSLALFLAFRNARIPEKAKKPIAFFAPAALGVYLIHEHEYLRSYVMTDLFRFLAAYPAPVMVAGAVLCALGIFLVCLIIDRLRHQLFLWLRLRERLGKLDRICRF